MKYKLINLKTKEEHLCDKVTIGNFDYYLTDNNLKRGWFYCYRTKSLFQDEGCDVNCCNSDINVLATNNPNIDILKVVDEVEELESLAKQTAELKIPLQIFPDAHVERRWFFEGHIDGYNKHKETHPFTEEDMIEFGKWLVNQKWDKVMVQGYNDDGSLKCKTTEELLQLWREQQPKIVWYQ